MGRLYKPGRSSIAVLVSGGLDSAVLVADLARQHRVVTPIYIRQGLAWESVELYWLRRFLRSLKDSRIRPLQVFSLPMNDVYGAHWSVGQRSVPGARTPDQAVYLPGRNLALVIKSAVYCAQHKIPTIALGSLNHNPFPDATPKFFKLWSKTLRQALHVPLSIQTPYRSKSKAEVIQRGADLPLGLSFSCLAPVGRKHCGRCNKCFERQKAFRVAGVKDPTAYAKR